jgi:hypothetical protein
MCLFLTLVLTICSVALKEYESAPVYEQPQIIRHDQLKGGKTVGFSKSRLQLVKINKI